MGEIEGATTFPSLIIQCGAASVITVATNESFFVF